MNFYTGLHMPNHAKYFERCFISINRLESRKSDFEVNDWILDSGAFTRIVTGAGHMPIEDYATHIDRWSKCGNCSDRRARSARSTYGAAVRTFRPN